MGYLNNSSVTVDAILTNKGRENLSMGAGNFNISKFALSDDEVDYGRSIRIMRGVHMGE